MGWFGGSAGDSESLAGPWVGWPTDLGVWWVHGVGDGGLPGGRGGNSGG